MSQRGSVEANGVGGLKFCGPPLTLLFSFAFTGQIPPSGPSFHSSARPSFQRLKRETGGSSR